MNPHDEMPDSERNALEEAMITDHEQRRVNENLGNIRLDNTQDVLQLPEFHFDEVDPAQMKAVVEHKLAPYQVNLAHMEAEVEEARALEATDPHLVVARLEDMFSHEKKSTLEILNSNSYVYNSNPTN